MSAGKYGELPLTGSPEYKPTGLTRVALGELGAHEGGEAAFRAWVENARVKSAKLAFLLLRQGGETVQAVVAASEGTSKQMVRFCGGQSTESLLLVVGKVVRSPEEIKSATVKDYEVHVTQMWVEAKAEVPLPLQVDDAERPVPAEGTAGQAEETVKAAEGEDAGAERPLVGLNTRLNNRTLDLRAKINNAIFTIKSGVCALFQEFLSARGFVLVQTPKLLGAATEGGANVFEVKYFDRSAYLAQSPQLYKQMLVASRFPRVMEMGPVFRAENSNTARHLTEFTGLDLEMEFQEDYHEVLSLLEELMLFIFQGLRERYARETELVRASYPVEDFKLPEKGKVPRISFNEGIEMLREAGETIGDYDDLR